MTGDSLVWIDFYFYEVLLNVDFVLEGKLFTQYENLKAYNDRMSELPGLKEYLDSGVEQARIWNGKQAKVNNYDIEIDGRRKD
mmetsp:Transcript_22024/g.15730  ORF Transcript_22024/g.15730 Transcript_22024/m.15730 type:complete len:83 (+) Transcript_22024:325-573(+)